ncbi:hypothetical protein BGZ76_011454 [Entomortierella beljakovae]|nr:hypothetical protein BGZ76_011454 [Entomortierella beljakovae]
MTGDTQLCVLLGFSIHVYDPIWFLEDSFKLDDSIRLLIYARDKLDINPHVVLGKSILSKKRINIFRVVSLWGITKSDWGVYLETETSSSFGLFSPESDSWYSWYSGSLSNRIKTFAVLISGGGEAPGLDDMAWYTKVEVGLMINDDDKAAKFWTENLHEERALDALLANGKDSVLRKLDWISDDYRRVLEFSQVVIHDRCIATMLYFINKGNRECIEEILENHMDKLTQGITFERGWKAPHILRELCSMGYRDVLLCHDRIRQLYQMTFSDIKLVMMDLGIVSKKQMKKRTPITIPYSGLRIIENRMPRFKIYPYHWNGNVDAMSREDIDWVLEKWQTMNVIVQNGYPRPIYLVDDVLHVMDIEDYMSSSMKYRYPFSTVDLLTLAKSRFKMRSINA